MGRAGAGAAAAPAAPAAGPRRERSLATSPASQRRLSRRLAGPAPPRRRDRGSSSWSRSRTSCSGATAGLLRPLEEAEPPPGNGAAHACCGGSGARRAVGPDPAQRATAASPSATSSTRSPRSAIRQRSPTAPSARERRGRRRVPGGQRAPARTGSPGRRPRPSSARSSPDRRRESANTSRWPASVPRDGGPPRAEADGRQYRAALDDALAAIGTLPPGRGASIELVLGDVAAHADVYDKVGRSPSSGS